MSVLELIPGHKPEAVEEEAGLLAIIEKHLTEDKWGYYRSNEYPAEIHVPVNGKTGRFACAFRVIQEKDMIFFYVYVSTKTPEGRHKEVVEYITRANFGCYIGNFEMNMETGDIRYKVSLDVEGGTMSTAMVSNMLSAGVSMVDRYHNGLMEVMFSHAIPATAVREAES
jgi:hypothetical protein